MNSFLKTCHWPSVIYNQGCINLKTVSIHKLQVIRSLCEECKAIVSGTCAVELTSCRILLLQSFDWILSYTQLRSAPEALTSAL